MYRAKPQRPAEPQFNNSPRRSLLLQRTRPEPCHSLCVPVVSSGEGSLFEQLATQKSLGFVTSRDAILKVPMNGQHRNSVRPGVEVDIVLKKDQGSGRLTRGRVKDILTNSPFHPHGIKVRLVSGDVGRVQEVLNALDETAAKSIDEPKS